MNVLMFWNSLFNLYRTKTSVFTIKFCVTSVGANLFVELKTFNKGSSIKNFSFQMKTFLSLIKEKR